MLKTYIKLISIWLIGAIALTAIELIIISRF